MTSTAAAHDDIENSYARWAPMIRRLARGRAPHENNGVTADDLFQTGSLKFVQAFPDLDLSQSKDRALMVKRIKAAMQDELRSRQNSVRRPRDVWIRQQATARCECELAQALQRQPTLIELADAVGSSPEVLREDRTRGAPPRSLDEAGPDGIEVALRLYDRDRDSRDMWQFTDEVAARLERQAHVARALSSLPSTTAEVIRLRWGLNEGVELTPGAIASRFGRSAEWVRCRQREGERHIRHEGLDRTHRRGIKLSARDLQALMPLKDLAWYNLTGADLTGADLRGADLTRAVLAEANLTGTDLSGALIPGVDLSQARIVGTDLSRANLSQALFGVRAKLAGGCFRGATLTEVDLTQAELSRTDLSGADLTTARLRGAFLTGADLAGANLAGADLTEASLSCANLTDANLASAELTGAYFTRANLLGAVLINTNLSGAYLGWVNLVGANLTNANLHNASLFDSNLSCANLPGAVLTRADLTSATLSRAYLGWANLAGANLTGADLTGADLTGADLTGADLTRADLTRADFTGADLTGTDPGRAWWHAIDPPKWPSGYNPPDFTSGARRSLSHSPR